MLCPLPPDTLSKTPVLYCGWVSNCQWFQWVLDAYTLWDWLRHLKFEWMGHGTETARLTSEEPHATGRVWACGTSDWLHRSLCKTRTFNRIYREHLWKPLYIWHTTSKWFSTALCWRTLCPEFLTVLTFHVLHVVASNIQAHTKSLQTSVGTASMRIVAMRNSS